jgi:hypothetical protein
VKWKKVVFYTPKALKGVCSIANTNLKLSPWQGRLKTFIPFKMRKGPFPFLKLQPWQGVCERLKKISGTNSMVTWGDKSQKVGPF